MELYTDILFRLHKQVVFKVEGGGLLQNSLRFIKTLITNLATYLIFVPLVNINSRELK